MSNDLTHIGVKGMKWGVRKPSNPSVGKAIGLGHYGNLKDYNNPEAISLRKSAGKRRIAGILLQSSGLAITALGGGSSGARAVGSILNVAGTATYASSVVTAVKGIKIENNSR